MYKLKAFTLAEVLITLAVIGVVAVLTIPALIKNYNEHAWSTAQSVFEKRLEVAVKQLNTEEKLAGYSSTMDFVNELKTKIKIINVCNSNNLSKCFEKNIMSADDHYVDTSSLKTSAQLAKEDWGTETVGVQFANGINALIAYNPNTDQQPFNNKFSATEASMAILYDVSGNKNPNIIGKDIYQNANVKTLGCMVEPDLLGGMCISNILAPGTGYSPLSKAECEEISDKNYGNKKEFCGAYTMDYWAGAVKACGGINNMPSSEVLTELAKYLYNTENINSGTSYATLDNYKVTKVFTSNVQINQMFLIWTKEESDSDYAGTRLFAPTYTVSSVRGRGGGTTRLAVCISD